MNGDPRHTQAGTALPIGAAIVAACVAIATDADFRPIVRVLWLLPALVVIAVAMIWSWRALRSRGGRVARGGKTDRGSGG
jgi:ABC-type sugar transport system permease subunit